MGITLNWPLIGGVLLIASGAIFGAAQIGVTLWKRRASAVPRVPVVNTVGEKPPRPSDMKPSIDAVDWVKDIVHAMGSASADSVLASLTAGESRDEARSRRIAELEATPETTS